MKKTLITILALTILTGCSQSQTTDSIESKNTVVVSFYPLEYLAQELLPEKVEVINITSAKDPHSYELTPKDLQKLTEADLFVFQGANLESWASQVEEQREEIGKPNFEVAHKIELMDYKEEDHNDDHDEDEYHDQHEEEHHDDHEDEEGHNHGDQDPHTWLDPALHSETAQALAEELSIVYPQYKDQIKENLETLQANLGQLDEKYTSTLHACKTPQAISSHDAFSYQEDKYNFRLFSIAGLSPQEEPTPAKLAELVELSEKEQITTILQEEFNNQSFSDTIKKEANLQVVTIHTLESSPADKDYIQVMEENLNSLAQAFNCH